LGCAGDGHLNWAVADVGAGAAWLGAWVGHTKVGLAGVVAGAVGAGAVATGTWFGGTQVGHWVWV